jgi:hypothetical protein
VCGQPKTTWIVSPKDIQLATHADHLMRLTEDPLTRLRKRVQSTSPTELVSLMSDTFQKRVSRIPVSHIGELYASATKRAMSAADSLENYLADNSDLLPKGFEGLQRAARSYGAPVAPEELRALRHAPGALFARIAEAASSCLGVAERAFDSVIEERTYSVRRQLPLATLPHRICREIRSGLENSPAILPILWLEFVTPSGYLPLVAWERVLQEATTMPILRLPYHAVESFDAGGCQNVVVYYASSSWNAVPSPAAVAEMVGAMASARSAERNYCIHVFAEQRRHAELEAALRLRHLNPSQGASIRLAPLPSPDVASEANAWIRWIREALADVAVDVVHVIGAPQLINGKPALVIPRSPRSDAAGPAPWREVRPVELAGLANSLGAQATVWTAFGSDEARIALRLLVDDIAQERPGTAVFHDFLLDTLGPLESRFVGLTNVYSILSRRGFAVHPACTIYCHPAQVSMPHESSANAKTARLNAAVPAWVAATHRTLEQLLSEALSGEAKTPTDRAMVEGAKAARMFVSALLSNAESMPAKSTPQEAADAPTIDESKERVA